MAALPDELIDLVSLCGPARPRARAPGASTATRASGRSGVTPMAWDRDERLEQLRLVAELAAA